MYIWTKKAEKLIKAGNVIAGKKATLGGKTLEDGKTAETWKKMGYICRAGSTAEDTKSKLEHKGRTSETVSSYCPACRTVNIDNVPCTIHGSMGFVCTRCGAEYRVTLDHLRKAESEK